MNRQTVSKFGTVRGKPSNTDKLPDARNTPTSTIRFQTTQLVRCYHAFKLRELTENRNSWCDFERKRRNPNPFVKVKEEPPPSSVITDPPVTFSSPIDASEVHDEDKEEEGAPLTGLTGVEIVDPTDEAAWSELLSRAGVFDACTRQFDKIVVKKTVLRTYVPGDSDAGVRITQHEKGKKLELYAYGNSGSFRFVFCMRS